MDGMEAVIEAPIESTPVETTEAVETQETTEVPTEQPEVETQETEQTEVDGDGRALPKDVQAALKALRESSPKVAEALRKAYFSSQQFGQLYKNPSEAKSAKIALETAGGPEGIATMREAVQASEFLEKAAEAGDPSVIENWAKDFPDGFKKAMPHALKQFQKMDQQGFEKSIQPHVYGAMESAGLGSVLESIWEANKANKPEDVKALIQKTYNWLNEQKSLADKSNIQTVDPEREKFDNERKQFNQEREKAFQGDIGRETVRHQQTKIDTVLTPYLKGKTFTPEGKAKLLRTINIDINETLKADQSYQRQVKAFLGKRDAAGATRFIKDHLDTVVPGIVQSTWTALYGRAVTAKPNAQPTNGAKPTIQGGPLKVTTKPPLSEVSKEPGYMEAYIAGKAIMANGPNKGKLVSWR